MLYDIFTFIVLGVMVFFGSADVAICRHSRRDVMTKAGIAMIVTSVMAAVILTIRIILHQ